MNDDTRPSLGDTSHLVAIATVALYAIGFVVTNAYLAKWDAATFDLASANYIAAGLLFACFVGIFWFVVWRRLEACSHDIAGFRESLASISSHGFWWHFASAYVRTEILFSFFAAATWTASLFLVRNETLSKFSGVLLLLYILDFEILIRNGGYSRWPRASLLVSFGAYVSVIVFVAVWVRDTSLYSTLVLYVGVAYVGTVIVDIKARLKASKAFTVFWAITFVTMVAASFGHSVYGHIESSIGGGQPRAVDLYLSPSAGEAIELALQVNGGKAISVSLVAETPSEFIVAKQGDASLVYRIARSNVAAIRSRETKTEFESNKALHATR
jgi:hypothetical protein